MTKKAAMTKIDRKTLVEIEYNIFHLIEDIKTLGQFCENAAKEINALNERIATLEQAVAGSNANAANQEVITDIAEFADNE